MEIPEREKRGGGMREEVCLITGATPGIGRAAAMGLADVGASVMMVGRDLGRGEAAMAEIKEGSANDSVDPMLADLSPREQVRRPAHEFEVTYPRLDVLVNNAGLFSSERITTANAGRGGMQGGEGPQPIEAGKRPLHPRAGQEAPGNRGRRQLPAPRSGVDGVFGVMVRASRPLMISAEKGRKRPYIWRPHRRSRA
jgi:NAD(P)-dependent dehydrogenase (short-subunit alcohol dehydrogenase family)